MNNIYIGNRYVPVFANPIEWDNLREYEPLTIVTYQGTSYTSKIRVPVGVELSNTDYWAVTGNYNAQVETYRQEVRELETAVDELSDDVDSGFTNVNNRIDDVSGRVTTNANNISGLTNRVNMITNKRVVIIGDSYSVGTTSSGTVNGWSTHFKNISGLSNSDCYIFDEGGCGFIGNITNKFIDLVNNNYEQVSNRDTITDVLIVGGYNDAGKGTEALISAIHSCIERVNELFVNATVWVGMVGYSIRPNGITRQQLIETAHSYVVATIASGAKYLIDSELFFLSDAVHLMSDDEIHPNNTGYYILGNAIWDAITTGGCVPIGQPSLITVGFMPASNVTFSSPKYCYINGRTKELFISGANPSVDFASPVDITGNSSIEIGTITDKSFCGNDESVLSEQTCRVAVQTNNTFYGYNATLYISNNKLYLKFKDIPDNGDTSWKGFTAVSNIYFVTRRFTFDARLV